MDLIITILPVVSKDLPISPRFMPYDFLSRCKFSNPTTGQGKLIFPCPRSRLRIWSREPGSAVPSRVSLLMSILRLNLVLTYGFLLSSAAASIYFKTTIRHRVSPELIGLRNCVPMAFTAESPSAQGQ